MKLFRFLQTLDQRLDKRNKAFDRVLDMGKHISDVINANSPLGIVDNLAYDFGDYVAMPRNISRGVQITLYRKSLMSRLMRTIWHDDSIHEIVGAIEIHPSFSGEYPPIIYVYKLNKSKEWDLVFKTRTKPYPAFFDDCLEAIEYDYLPQL